MEHKPATLAEEIFDHPCKQTCSGWEQGRQRGLLEGQDEIKHLRLEIELALTESSWPLVKGILRDALARSGVASSRSGRKA